MAHLSRREMVEIVSRGESVVINGVIHSNVATLPSETDLAMGNEAQLSTVEQSLMDEIASRQREVERIRAAREHAKARDERAATPVTQSEATQAALPPHAESATAGFVQGEQSPAALEREQAMIEDLHVGTEAREEAPAEAEGEALAEAEKERAKEQERQEKEAAKAEEEAKPQGEPAPESPPPAEEGKPPSKTADKPHASSKK